MERISFLVCVECFCERLISSARLGPNMWNLFLLNTLKTHDPKLTPLNVCMYVCSGKWYRQIGVIAHRLKKLLSSTSFHLSMAEKVLEFWDVGHSADDLSSQEMHQVDTTKTF